MKAGPPAIPAKTASIIDPIYCLPCPVRYPAHGVTSGGSVADLNLEQGLEVLEGRTRLVRWSFIAILAITAGLLALAAVAVPRSGTAIAFLNLAPLILFAVILASHILTLTWIYRAHANLRQATPDGLEFTPGWAVGWYFVPIANLFKPYQAMRELWASSQGYSDRYGDEAPRTIKLWWGFWIAGGLLSNILGAAGIIFFIPAGYFLLQIIRTIDCAQRSTLAAASTFA